MCRGGRERERERKSRHCHRSLWNESTTVSESKEKKREKHQASITVYIARELIPRFKVTPPKSDHEAI